MDGGLANGVLQGVCGEPVIKPVASEIRRRGLRGGRCRETRKAVRDSDDGEPNR